MARTIDFDLGDISWADAGELGSDGFVEPEPGYDASTQFDDQFEMRSRELNRKPNNLTPVTIAQNRNGAWSGNNQLGIQQLFAPDANNRQTILKLDEWGPPTVWSLTLGISYSDASLAAFGGLGFGVQAIIQFGAGGVTQEVEVDWVQGTVINLDMNALNVIAQYSDTRSIPRDLLLRASIAQRPISNSVARFSVDDTAGPTDFGSVVRIPPFTKSIQIIARSATSASNLYAAGNFLQLAGSPTGSGSHQVRGDNILSFSNGVPICSSDKYVMFFNGGVAGLIYTFIFNIGM